MRYVPTSELDGRPHVVVDGAPRPGTALTLSHWPGTPTPPELWADVSAEIVAKALESRSRLPAGVDLATVDHYDADGMLSLATLVLDDVGDEHRDLMVRAAHAGDFDVVDGRDAAMVAFALGALGDDATEASTPDEACAPDRAPDATARAASRALRRLPALLADPESGAELWQAEMSAYDASVALLESGMVTIEELADIDVAVVRVHTEGDGLSDAGWDGAVVHPAAVHSSTDRLRICTVADHRYELRYRYETWVRLATRRALPRVDLAALAASLTSAEPDGATWEFDGASAIVGALHLQGSGPSGLGPERFLEALSLELALLDQGPPAWDPYRGFDRLVG